MPDAARSPHSASSRRTSWPASARLLMAALWAGSIWAVSYLAAPSAFAVLDSARAGDVVAVMLTRAAWLAIVLAVLLAALVARSGDLDARRRRLLFGLIAGMLACSLAVYLGLQPAMAAIRESAGPAGVRASPLWGRFAALHGVSQVLYLIESILAAVLVVKAK